MARFKIDPDSVSRIHATLRSKDNWDEVLVPLDIVGAEGLKEDETAFGVALQSALEVRNPTRCARMADILPGFDAPTMHPVSQAILDHYGVSPVDLAILCAASARSIDIDTEDGGLIGFWHSQRDPMATVTLHLSDGAIWEQSDDVHSLEIWQRLPQTILSGLPGTPLARLVSHPALDPLQLVISQAEIYEKNGSTVLELAERPPMDKEQPMQQQPEALPRVATGIAVVDRRGALLCIRRSPHAVTGASDWAIPGGKLDPGETLAACAARELLEETGIAATKIRRLHVITEDMAWGPDNHFVTVYFLVTEWTGEPRIMEPAKHTEMAWLFPSQIRSMIKAQDADRSVFEPLVAFEREGGLAEAWATVRLADAPEPVTDGD